MSLSAASPENISNRLNFEALEEGVFLAGAGELNDPDEGRIQWQIDGTKEAAIELVANVLAADSAYTDKPTDLIVKAWEIAESMVANGPVVPKHIVDCMHQIVSKTVRVVCFTDDPLNPPMWAHYGTYLNGNSMISNGGLCIEYEVQDSWRGPGLHSVDYWRSRPTINMLFPKQLSKQFAQAMRVKNEGWSYERKWRIAAFLQTAPPWQDGLEANSKLQLSGSVRSVIFGLATPTDILNEAVGMIRAKNSAIRLMRVQRNPIDQSLVLLTI